MIKSQEKQVIYRQWWRPSRAFIASLLGWLVGVSLPAIPLNPNSVIVLLILTGVTLAIWPLRLISFMTLIVASSLAGSIYWHWYLMKITPRLPNEESRELIITVLEKPKKYDDQARYKARTSEGWSLYLHLPREPAVTPGTTLIAAGQLQPVGQLDETYRMSLAQQHIFAKLANPKIIDQRPARLDGWERLLIKARSEFDSVIGRLFTQPQAALFSGLVSGDKSDLPSNLLDDFKATGLSHIIAVSGFNVTVVINLLSRWTRKFGQWPNLGLISLAILSFVVFTGSSASVVRAGLLAGLLVVARTVGRRASLFRVLIFVAFIMTVHNPLTSRYDIGFQLSFVAVVGLIFFSRPIEDCLINWQLPAWLAEILSATMAAQLTTLPVTGFYFQTFSLASLPANILVGPLVPLITAAGLPLVAIASLTDWLDWLYYPLDFGLRFIILVAQIMADIPLAQLTLPIMPALIWLMYYPLISTWLLARKPKAIS